MHVLRMHAALGTYFQQTNACNPRNCERYSAQPNYQESFACPSISASSDNSGTPSCEPSVVAPSAAAGAAPLFVCGTKLKKPSYSLHLEEGESWYAFNVSVRLSQLEGF